MKFFVHIILIVLCFFGSVYAETWYVDDLREITFRTGPGMEHKIINMLYSGQKMEVIQPEKDWSKVRLPNGKEGWVVSRFISTSPPSRLVAQELKEKNQKLINQSRILLEENTQIKRERDLLNAELLKTKQAFSDINHSYESLKQASSEFFELKNNYDRTASQLVEQTEKVEQLENKLEKLQSSQNIKWFLAGGGVLSFGLLIGFSARRQRRRSTLI